MSSPRTLSVTFAVDGSHLSAVTPTGPAHDDDIVSPNDATIVNLSGGNSHPTPREWPRERRGGDDVLSRADFPKRSELRAGLLLGREPGLELTVREQVVGRDGVGVGCLEQPIQRPRRWTGYLQVALR
jgi:hypothetical protein